ELLAIIGAAVCFYGLLGWLAGRHPGAEKKPDPVRAPRLEALAVGVAYLGLLAWIFRLGSWGAGLFAGGIVGWVAVAGIAGYRARDFGWLGRSWRPFVPLLVGVLAPKLLLAGAALPGALLVALPSGVIQQLLLQLGLTARLEALTRRPDVAAVVAAICFGLPHAPLNLGQAGGDWALALANALVLQAPIGLAFCLAYQRHRAPLALGAVHGLVIA
ncbi:MAG TPA: CPBP family glutamic-type intramembrane protease, partial [Candidatus Limnocylindrales bacterium]|nr:CPBP family glutamic-type intramembrane protease [Candidatus Limnocylindrales bacterium]